VKCAVPGTSATEVSVERERECVREREGEREGAREGAREGERESVCGECVLRESESE
jgi:hypothetical protein